MAMTEIAVLMVAVDERVVQDLERFGIRRTVTVPQGADIEGIVAARVKGEEATIFASPRRRWRDVMEAVRTAARVVGGGVTLRFYQPDCVIDVRSPIDATRARFGVCPLLDPREEVQAESLPAIARLKRAVKSGMADMLADEMRALRAELVAHARAA